MRGCATLENGLVLERPSLDDKFPRGVFYESSAGVLKIGVKVGAKKNARPLCRMAVHGGQKRRLKEPVLVVAFFGPRIGKENEDAAEPEVSRQDFQKQKSIGLNKTEVRELRTLLFSACAVDAITIDVEAEALRIRMRLRVSDEKVAVPASHFEDQPAVIGRELFDERS